MELQKEYVVDTNVLLEDPQAIFRLRKGNENTVYIPYLNIENNGMKWVVNMFKGNPIYAHLVLKGDKSRGPITDLVIRSGL